MEKQIVSAPVPTLRRLPKYIHLLKRMKAENIEYVSATTIAEELGLEAIQVRKDLSLTGIVGKPKLGFELEELINSIREFLNWNNVTDAFLVGVGALGEAIIGYENFKSYGLNIIAAFDVDPKKIGKEISGDEVFSIDKLYDLIQRMKINIGIIRNFGSIDLKVPEQVILENVHLSQSLAVLTHKLAKNNIV